MSASFFMPFCPDLCWGLSKRLVHVYSVLPLYPIYWMDRDAEMGSLLVGAFIGSRSALPPPLGYLICPRLSS